MLTRSNWDPATVVRNWVPSPVPAGSAKNVKMLTQIRIWRLPMPKAYLASACEVSQYYMISIRVVCGLGHRKAWSTAQRVTPCDDGRVQCDIRAPIASLMTK